MPQLQRHIQKFAPEIESKTLFQYDLAVSPHLAAQVSKRVGRCLLTLPEQWLVSSASLTFPPANQHIPSDNALLDEIARAAAHEARRNSGWLFVETAGGVHSPSPSGTTQADLYMPLRLPVVLVGDSKLGGISQTISAFESLKIRGYDVETVLLFQEDQYQNYLYLAEYFEQKHGIPVKTVPEPPQRAQDSKSDAQAMSQYYNTNSAGPALHETLTHLDTRHKSRIARLESMSTTASHKIWYPFTQQKHVTPSKITVIDSAHGDYFQTLAPPNNPNDALLQPSFDASASWWTQGLGHANPSLSLAAAHAAGRYGHVMFAEAVHEPALALAETLLGGMRNPRLTRAFFSDNGSTGTEVALKMALRAARVRYGWKNGQRAGVLGLQGSYHGDTIGAMDCSEPGVFNEKVEWYEGRGYWFAGPTVWRTSGKAWEVVVPAEMEGPGGGGRFASLDDVFDVEAREARGEHHAYERFIIARLEKLAAEGRRFGALMIEPVVLGAGGMLLV